MVENNDIDAIAIATPVNSHFELGMEVLKAGKHLWLEKPMTETSEQARKLLRRRKSANWCLNVDHTFIYTGAIRKVGELVKSGELGDIHYYDSTRINLGYSSAMSTLSPIWQCTISLFSTICLGSSRWPFPLLAPTTFQARRKFVVSHLVL